MNSLQKGFQHLIGFLDVIEQKNILILCLKELNTDSTKLRFPNQARISKINNYSRNSFIKILEDEEKLKL